MTHVVAVNHDRRNGHACLPADFHRIEGLDKRRHSTLLECLHGLHYQFPSPGGGACVCPQVEPCMACVAASVRVMPHVWRATKAGKPPSSHGGGVCVAIHL